MGTLKIIDVYDTAFNQKKYLCVILYNDKQRCIVKIYKEYNESLYNECVERLYADVSSYIKPRIKRDGTTVLDIEF